MGDFNDHGEVLLSTGGLAQDALFARNIAANRRVSIRDVRATYDDPGGVGGGAVFLIQAQRPDGTVIAAWGTALFSSAAGEVAQFGGDIQAYFDSGDDGCTLVGTVGTQNAGCRAGLSLSGRYQ